MRASKGAHMHKGYQVLLLLFFLGFCAVLAKYWPTNSNDWASWVQAMGTIIAIVGSYWLGEREYRRDRGERDDKQRAESVRQLNLVLAAVNLTCDRVGYLVLSMRGDPPIVKEPDLSAVSDCVGVLADSLNHVTDNPGVWVAGTRLRQNLLRVVDMAEQARDADAPRRANALELSIRQSNQYISAAMEMMDVCRAAIHGVHAGTEAGR